MAPLAERAALDPAAPVGAAKAAPLHYDRDLPYPPVRDPTVEARAPVGTYPALDAMPDLRVLLHGTNL